MILITTSFIIINLLLIISSIKTEKKYIDIIIITLLFLIYSLLELKYNFYLSNYIRLNLIITSISHSLLGNYFGFYLRVPIFDTLLHVFGIYAFTLFAYSLINQLFPDSSSSKIRKYIFIISLGISLGVIFEIIEFLIDMTIKPDIKNQKSLLDTNTDLIADIIGAVIASLHLKITNFNLIFLIFMYKISSFKQL